MTELLSDIETPSDAELISRVRGGDVAAYGELFSRHVDAAKRLARQLVRGPDADDLVSDAFAKVLHVLQGGGGPDVAFRAYLLTAVRRLHVDRVRAQAKLHTTDDLTPFDPGIPFQDTAVAGFESGAAARAFASLPERWQLVLWHLEVEGQKPADIAPLLGMSANSVSALAYRAREGLRQAFLTMHLSDISDAECRWVNEHLGAYVRKGLSKRDNAKVAAHLDECRRCTATYLELTEVNSNLAGIIAPLLLGAAATGYVASAGGGGMAGLLTLFSRGKDVVLANSGAATAAGVAAGVAAIATAGIVLGHVRAADTVNGAAERPGITTSTAPTPSGSPSAQQPSTGTSNTHVGSSPLPIPTTTAGPAFVLGPGAPTSTTGPGAPGTDQPAPGLTDVPTGAPTGAPPQTGGPSPSSPASPSAPSSPSDTPTDTPTPTDPAPSGTPTDNPSSVVDSDVHLGVPSIVGGALVVDLSGTPALPSSVLVELSGEPAGISFAPDAGCTALRDDHTLVSCPTSATTSGRASRTAVRTEDTSYTLRLPLAIPAGQPDTQLHLKVSVPSDRYTDPVTTDNEQDFQYVAPPPSQTKQVDLSLRAPDSSGIALRNDLAYSVTSRVSGAASLSNVSYTVTGGATFGDPLPAGCDNAVPAVLTCSAPQADGPVTFVLRATNPSEPQIVSISASSTDDYTDPAPGNEGTGIFTLPGQADVSVSNLTLTDGTPDANGDFAGSADIGGAAQLSGVTFSLPDGAAFADVPASCSHGMTPSELVCDRPDGSLTFRVSRGSSAPMTLAISVHVPDGYVDTNPGNNRSNEVDLTDVGIQLPDKVTVDSDGQATVHTMLTGVNGLPSVTLKLSGDAAKFVVDPSSDCSDDPATAGTTVTCLDPTDHVDLVVQPENPEADNHISITAAAPDGWLDPVSDNNTAETTLSPRPAPPADDNLIFDSVTAKHGWDRVMPPFGHVTPLHAKVHGVPGDATSVRFSLSGEGTGADQIRFDPALLPPDGGGQVDCTLDGSTEVVCSDKPGTGRTLPGSFWVDLYVVRPYGVSPGQVTLTATPDVADNPDDNWQEVTVY